MLWKYWKRVCSRKTGKCEHIQREQIVNDFGMSSQGGSNTWFFLLFFFFFLILLRWIKDFNGQAKPISDSTLAGLNILFTIEDLYVNQTEQIQLHNYLSKVSFLLRLFSFSVGFVHPSRTLRPLEAFLLWQGCWTSGNLCVPSSSASLCSTVPVQ